jgi:WD40 repeat protein
LFDANDNVVVVDAVAGREEFRFKLVGSNTANTAVSPDGKWLVCSIPDGGLKLWDVERRGPVQTFPAPADFPALQFSPDGARLAVGGQDGAVKIWDVASGKLFHTFDSPAERAVAVLYSPDGKWLAVFGGANLTISEVRILDAETGEEVQRPLKITNPSAFTFSPDSRRLVIGNPDGTVKLWDQTTGQETLTLNGHTGRVTSLAFSPDGRRLISAGADFTVRTWDATPRAE